MALQLHETQNPITREERAKINENWRSISDAMTTLYNELQGMAATDFADLIDQIQGLERRAESLCNELENFSDEQVARLDEAAADSEAATAAAQALTNELQAELAAIQSEFDALTAEINSRVNGIIDEAVASAGTATTAATNAATSANNAATKANTAAASVDTAKDNANAAATAASTAATNADAATTRANTAAANADRAAAEADAAAETVADKLAELEAQSEAIAAALTNVSNALSTVDTKMLLVTQLQAVGTYSSNTSYKTNNIVEYNGSSFIALQESKGIQPPTLPTTRNSSWQLIAQRGVDGTGSVVSVNGIAPDASGNVTISTASTWNELQGKPETFTPAAHDHPEKVNVENPETSGVLFHKGNGTGTMDVVLKIQSNNGVLTGYGDLSSNFHLSGVGVAIDDRLFVNGGITFAAASQQLDFNGAYLQNVARLTHRGSSGMIETGCDFNDGSITNDQHNIIVKNTNTAAGQGSVNNAWSYQSFSYNPTTSEYERTYGVKVDGTIISKGEMVRPDFIVNISTADNINYAADKTHAEILEAFNAGCNCMAYSGKFYLPLIVANANIARFAVLNGFNIITFSIGAAGATSYTVNSVITADNGGTLASGATLTLSQEPTADMMAATKKYVDDLIETHTHTGEEVSGVVKTVNGSAPDASGNVALQIAATWDDLQGKPSTFTPSTHSHAISEVTNLQSALDGKADTGHTHAIADVTGLQEAINNASIKEHTHEISEINGLQEALDSKVATFTYGDEDLTAGESELGEGVVYLFYT